MCSHNQLCTRLVCTAKVASVIQPYIVLILSEVLDIKLRLKTRLLTIDLFLYSQMFQKYWRRWYTRDCIHS